MKMWNELNLQPPKAELYFLVEDLRKILPGLQAI